MSKIFITYLLFQFVLFALTGYSQSRWVKIYHDEQDAPMKYIQKSYDKGYLLSGKSGANYSKYNWIIKTDVNGENLWEKTIGDGIHSIVLFEMALDDGNLYTCGESRHQDPYGDPILIKLNACGEKEWCKVLYSEDHHDFAHCICPTPDGGCAVTLDVTGSVLYEDRICLAKFSPEGQMEWKQCYNSPDSLMGNEIDENVILTPDNGFLISGWCFHNDPTGTFVWVYPYYIKTDSLGNFEWEKVVLVETLTEGGQAWQTMLDPSNQFYYSSISHYYFSDNTSSPALVKMDMNGNTVDIYDVKDGYINGKIFTSVFINDSLLACGAGWGNSDDDFVSMALFVDTLGNIMDSCLLQNDIYLSHVRKTFDGKLLFYNQTHLGGEFDVYLFKFNQDQEDDTLYSFPFTYDSLCPYQIISDTIGYENCDLIVGIEDGKTVGREEGSGWGIELWPNPASTQISVSLTSCQSSVVSHQLVESLTIQIYDVYGRMVKEELQSPYFSDGENEANWKIDVSNLPIGLYLVTVNDGQTFKASGKFLVAR